LHISPVQFLTALFLMFAAAKVMAEIFERFKQPAVAGEILAGIIIGPALLNWVQPSDITAALAEIGVILLMFAVGLETQPRDILQVGKTAMTVAVIGVLIPFVLCGGAVLWCSPLLGQPVPAIEAIFVGAAAVATSVGITARVLADLHVLNHQASRIILAAAVIDDILALLVLAMVSSLAQTGGINWLRLGFTLLTALGFMAVVVIAGQRIVSKMGTRLRTMRMRDPLFASALMVCFGLAWISEYIGIAAIIGAFLAGMALADLSEQSHLLKKTESAVNLMLPFFLVNIGMQVHLSELAHRGVIAVAVIITLLAVLGKFLGGWLAARKQPGRIPAQVGMGMVPRGEVGIVAAQLGLALGAINARMFAIVLFMAVATTLIAPPFLRRLFAGETDGERESQKPMQVE
jgi:Kef-type K+ transport system membrane component KefB